MIFATEKKKLNNISAKKKLFKKGH